MRRAWPKWRSSCTGSCWRCLRLHTWSSTHWVISMTELSTSPCSVCMLMLTILLARGGSQLQLPQSKQLNTEENFWKSFKYLTLSEFGRSETNRKLIKKLCFASGEGDEGTVHMSDYVMAAKRGEMVPPSGWYTNCSKWLDKRQSEWLTSVINLNCLKMFQASFRLHVSTLSLVKMFNLFMFLKYEWMSTGHDPPNISRSEVKTRHQHTASLQL